MPFNYGSDNHDLLWSGVSGDHEVQQQQAGLVHAKVAVAQYWPFLSRATNEKDFENRLDLTQERIAALVPSEYYDDVISSLRDDYRLVTATYDTDNEARDKGAEHEPDTIELMTRDAAQKTAEQNYQETMFPVDLITPAPAHNAYTPDENRDWRYHKAYEPLVAPVNNGDSQGPDGFPINLADGEGRSNTKIEEFQLTPGVWTQHDGMPERPMPFSQQRGYMPVNASSHYDDVSGDPYGDDDETYGPKTKCSTCKGTGWAPGKDPNKGESFGKISDYCPACYGSGLKQKKSSHTASTDAVVCKDGNCAKYHWAAGGQRYGLANEHPKGESVETDRLPVTASFDAQGYFVEKTANKYIKRQGDQWVITQKGTGKVLSHHDSQEEAQKAFEAMEAHKHGSRSPQFDAQGFLVEASEGRGVDPLQDPVPGQPQQHNPFYFQEGSNLGGNVGFPVDPSEEPHPNNLDTIYGDVPPLQSGGTAMNQVDGAGYSRLNSTSAVRFDSQGYLVESPNFT